MTTCIDLRQLAGKRYRLGHDHKPEVRATDDPWLLTLLGARGHVYPHSDKLLGVATNGRGPTVTAIAALSGVEVVQDGTDGINATFPPELLPKVAKLIGLRTRRQLTPEQRAASIERLAAYKFPPAQALAAASGIASGLPKTANVST